MKKIVYALPLALMVLTGCSSQNVGVENATEVALDDADAPASEVQNLDAQDQKGHYVIKFDYENGQYTYEIGHDGLIQDRSFKALEQVPAPEQPVEEETPEESTPKHEEEDPNFITKAQAQENALLNAGLSPEDVTGLSSTLHKNQNQYEVEFSYGDTTNLVTVDATTGEVLSSVIE